MMQFFNFIVQHRKGQQNRNADVLSRMPFKQNTCFEPGEEERNVTGADDLHSSQLIDDEASN